MSEKESLSVDQLASFGTILRGSIKTKIIKYSSLFNMSLLTAFLSHIKDEITLGRFLLTKHSSTDRK